ncbi:hypothetical protein FBEOM_1473 [Fusarium beomiforme]|uniref:Xanthan lyase n=1 Tax=Fusarium beomiforme TaxID=44412 RepID=A0A9P5E365_9HYPO|nr:hypothetical protein FBEOM_1473 [Fusarium beomiforme]
MHVSERIIPKVKILRVLCLLTCAAQGSQAVAPSMASVHIVCLYLVGLFTVSVLSATSHESDVVIYGNTVAALAAAIQTVRLNKTATLVFPTTRIGGLTTSGLGWTDSKDGNTIGGIAREFYSKVFDYYNNDDVWTHETRDDYLAKHIEAQPGPAIGDKVQWTFEPKVAEEILEKWIKDEGIPVFRNESIVRSSSGVKKDGAQIKSFQTRSGSTFSGKMFIDAGYEGDLMATAGISYRVGREDKQEFNEWAAGIHFNEPRQLAAIDPYIKPKDPDSGLLPGVGRVITKFAAQESRGKKDHRLQAFNYRLCLTREDDNKVEFFKPDGYNESDYKILIRYIKTGYVGPFFTKQLMPNLKTDTNAAGQISTDLIGGSYNKTSNYAEYSYEEREAVAKRHTIWAQGLLWTLANHKDVPKFIREETRAWGYAKDEWVDNGNWPYEIYVREARRMEGVYTMTQSDIQNPKPYDNDTVIAVGYYTLDVHQVERVVINDRIHDEGLIHVPNPGPFSIPYGSIIPRKEDATNFVNPVTMSATHIALSAIRMEPVYMIMGQSAGAAAVLAIEDNVSVQDVDRKKMKDRLKQHKQVVESFSVRIQPSWQGVVVGFTFCIYYLTA